MAAQAKTVLITGTTRGIGRTLAENFLADGWNVAACGRDEAQLKSIPKTASTQFIPLAFDMRETRSLEAAVKTTYEAFDSIDVLINNAGIHFPGTLETKPEDLRSLFEVNVESVHALLRLVVPQMKSRRSGHIINVASVAGQHGFPDVGSYGASKFALRGMTESLMHELNPFGIKVTSLCPSWVDTDMAKHAPFDGTKMIRPEDIYLSVQYLLSLSTHACVPELTVRCVSSLS